MNTFSTFKQFLNEKKYPALNDAMSAKPVLFLNFSFSCEDLKGEKYNVEDLMKKYVNFSVFSRLHHIHFFDGCVYHQDTKLENYALVFMGPVNEYENYILVENYCKQKNIPFIPYGAPEYQYNKYREMQTLSDAGIKIPKTYTCLGENCDAGFVSKNFEYPVVLKPAHGSQGKGVELVKDAESLKAAAKKHGDAALLIQEFIPNDCDYRVFFIDNQHIFNVKRTRKDSKEFRNNVSLGAAAERVVIGPKELHIAKRAHECLEFYASGVDLVQNSKTGEWYVLEVNAAPQFSVFGPEEVIKIFASNINNMKKSVPVFEELINETIDVVKGITVGKVYDIQFPGLDSAFGWKLSLQGKTIKDAIELYNLCKDYLEKNKIAFKVATKKRIEHSDREQSKKLLTIYVPDQMDHLKVAEDVYSLTKNYKGWHNIKTPIGYEHYAGAVFFRNDRNEYGEYTPTKKL